MKNVRTILIMALAVVLLSIGMASALVQEATVIQISDGRFTGTAVAGSNLAEGGNVTSMNLTTESTTARWQGYYGNVSGVLRLGVGTNVFYDFGTGADVNGVFASQDTNYDFTLLQITTAAEVDTRWAYAAGNDQAVDVYNDPNTALEGVSSVTVNLAGAANQFNTTAFDNGATAAKTDFAFGANVVDAGAASFDGTTAQYELMVPATGTETYYFFLSI